MATLYPNSIINSKSNAEIKIFKIFKTFSDDFHIIHSLPWLSLLTAHERNRYTPEGEIDFIILHKNYGILCIEIKGGKVIWDKRNLAGRKVASGIYIILLTLPDTSETSITKVAIIN